MGTSAAKIYISLILNCHNILNVDVFVGGGDHRDYSLCHPDQKSTFLEDVEGVCGRSPKGSVRWWQELR